MPDWDDEIVTGMCVLREGTPMAPAAVEVLGGAGNGGAGNGGTQTGGNGTEGAGA